MLFLHYLVFYFIVLLVGLLCESESLVWLDEGTRLRKIGLILHLLAYLAYDCSWEATIHSRTASSRAKITMQMG